MNDPKYVITIQLVCPNGVTAVAYYFFDESKIAYGMRRQMIATGQKAKFCTYDAAIHAAVWKDSKPATIEVVEAQPKWVLDEQ